MKKIFFLIIALIYFGGGKVTAQVNDIFSFNGTDGETPTGALMYSGKLLYGLAWIGGANGYGCIFSIDTDGTRYRDLFDFNETDGSTPYGTLLLSGGTMYGVTAGGGNGYGLIFSMDTNGSNYNILHEFNGADGSSPFGKVLLLGNKLYGITESGGTGQNGVIFSIDTDGSGFKDLFKFNGINGANPYGSLTFSGNKFYGMTETGGAYSYGVIFSIDTNGNAFSDMLSFNGSNGAYPFGTVLVLSGKKLFGMTDGYSYNDGNVFTIDTNGSNYKQILSFNGSNGLDPWASVTLIGNVLYGVTQSGPPYNDGNIFSVDTDGSGFYSIFGFDGSNASHPHGDLIAAGDALYGTAESGGSNNDGVIFRYRTCTLNASIVITQNISCHGGANGALAADLSGGLSPYTYLWSGGHGSNNTATGLSAGTYSLSVTDKHGCTSSALVTITQPTVIIVSANVTANVNCNGGNNGSATSSASGGTSPYTYLWSDANSQTTVTASGLSANTYTIKVKDNNGCSATATITITQPIALAVSTSIRNNVSCNGGNNGSSIAVASGGVSPYTYLWSNSQTTDSIIGLSAGTYSVIVNDSCGGSATVSVIITQPSTIGASVNVTANVSCNGGSNGSDSAVVSGGTSPYTYLWSDVNAQTTISATGLTIGVYTVIISDSCGASATASATITQPLAMSVTHDSVPVGIGCSGMVGVNESGGTSPYSYLWSPGGHTNDTIDHLCAGTYTCTITDNNGCLQSTYITINNCINNFNEPICIITIDTSNNKCEVLWGRTNSPPDGGYGFYNIYRDTIPGYGLVHTQVLDSLSEYLDLASDPSAGPVSYKLSTTDSCGESALSSPHTTMYLTTSLGVNVYILNWTAYIGFAPTNYRIFRGPTLNTLVEIDSVPNSVFTYHDTFPPPGVYYAVEAVNPNSPCIPTHQPNRLSGSFSNGFNTALLGVNNLVSDINNLNIYPNPSNGMFTLNYSMKQNDNIQITIINELGQTVYVEQKHTNAGSNTEQLNLENIAQGIYSIRLQTNTSITVRKLMKIN